jgi:pyrimidine-nucleoside phosphorylase
MEEFRLILEKDGFAMTGQTAEIVPADRLLYALRDVTGTVESIPLITASILSKIVAEGTEGLVLDVKFGSGAFMKERGDAEKLARSLVDTGTALGLRMCALLTDMDEPLGNMVGNFLEVEESLDCLEGKGPEDLMELTLELGSRMTMLAGLAKHPAEGRGLCEAALAGGRPRELFLANVESQGGDVKKLLAMRKHYRSEFHTEICASRSSFLARIDALKVGRAGVLLGVGRDKTGDAVSPTAGVQFHHKRGSFVKAGESVMTVWGRDMTHLIAAKCELESALSYSDEPPAKRTLLCEEIRRLPHTSDASESGGANF